MASSNRTAVITGASSGIGQASATALAKAGWNVALIARREDKLRETEALCIGAKTLVLAGDVTDEDFVRKSFELVVSTFGRLDLLFNNAGIASSQIPIEDTSLESFRQVVDVNLIGSFLCTREAVRIFKSQDPVGGRIINNGSTSAHVPRPHTASYTSTKHAITGLTKCTVLDGRKFNITCSQIDVGNTSSVLTSAFSGGTLQADGRMAPEPVQDVKHVADTIVHMASLPNDVTMLQVTVLPTEMPFIGRG